MGSGLGGLGLELGSGLGLGLGCGAALVQAVLHQPVEVGGVGGGDVDEELRAVLAEVERVLRRSA